MFSLVITVIAIFLVALLAIATIYYANIYAEQGQTQARTARLIQEGNQIAGALEVYRADHGAFPTGTSTDIQNELLNKNYLTSIPEGNWTFRNDYAVRNDLTQESCLAINKRLGLDSVPLCTDSAAASRTVCCEVSN